jgi:AcrR family transcriptional regulator
VFAFAILSCIELGENMPRDKSENHEKIIAAAYEEFMEYGFTDASMRRIATACGMSVSGLYKHFPSKEDMFASLVKDSVDGLMNLYHEIEGKYFEGIESATSDSVCTNRSEIFQAMDFIYDNIKDFELIICKSKGTIYENFIHDIAKLEEEVTMRYMEELKKNGIPVKDVNYREFHLLVSASIEAIFQAVSHGFTKDEALHYARTLENFYTPAWKNLFGI